MENPLVSSVESKMNNLIIRRRDYNIARNVSRRLKKNETGILFYGREHKPEIYINALSPDIEMVFHPQPYIELPQSKKEYKIK